MRHNVLLICKISVPSRLFYSVKNRFYGIGIYDLRSIPCGNDSSALRPLPQRCRPWINLFRGLDFTCLSTVPLRVLGIGVLYKCFAVLLSILLQFVYISISGIE
jgi:hypothetical protein